MLSDQRIQAGHINYRRITFRIHQIATSGQNGLFILGPLLLALTVTLTHIHFHPSAMFGRQRSAQTIATLKQRIPYHWVTGIELYRQLVAIDAYRQIQLTQLRRIEPDMSLFDALGLLHFYPLLESIHQLLPPMTLG